MAVITYEEHPELDRPIFIAAFQGWNDGGQAATTALEHLIGLWDASKFASIDPEDFYDFQVTRPHVTLTDGMTRRIDWPRNELFFASHDGTDFVLMLGVEPNLKWKTFTGGIVSEATKMNARSLVTMGAFLAEIPHTLLPPVTGVSSDPSLTDRLGLMPSQYQGPTGIVGIINSTASAGGLSAASLWTGVPHYLGPGANPRAARALIEKLAVVIDMPIDIGTLQEAESAWEAQVTEALSSSDEMSNYVQRLQDAYADNEDMGRIPSGEELAEELEQFLRREDGERGPGA